MERVKIDLKRSKNPEEAEKIKPVLPILRKYARWWKVPILVDYPHGEVQPPIYNRKLHLHLFSVPKKRFFFGVLSQIFGYSVPRDFRSYGDDIGTLLPYSRDGRVIISPEGDGICEILPGNIYILFDILHRDWEGKGPVLEQILEEAIPLAIEKNSSLLPKEGIKEALNRIAYLQRRRFLKERTQVLNDFLEFYIAPLKTELEEVEENLRSLRNDHEKTWQGLTKIDFKIEVLAGFLQDLRKRSRAWRKDYAREFELILKTKQVKGIRVEEKKIFIFTKKIIKQERDIGEWIIGIPYKDEELSHHYITLKKGIYRGAYNHGFLDDEKKTISICFGSELNNEIDKLFQEGDIFHIVQWCLFFLEEEETAPIKIIGAKKRVLKEKRPFYASREDKEKEKKKYVQAIKLLKEKTLKERIKEKLEKLKNQRLHIEKTFNLARSTLKETLSLEQYLKNQIFSQNLRYSEEFNRLESEVIEIRIVNGFCQILTKDRKKNPIRFWLTLNGEKIWARGPYLDSPQISKEGKVIFPSGFHKGFLSLLKKGEFSRAFFVLRDLM